MTSVSVAPATPRTPGVRGRVGRFLRTALRVGGLLVLAALALLHTALGSQLGHVSAVSAGPRTTETEALHAPSWWVVVALIALGMVVAPQWRRAGVDVTQLLAGLVLVTLPWPARAFWDSLPFATGDTHCRVASCWPMHEQSLLVVAPLVLAGALMLLASLLASRVPWQLRVLVPVVVWLVAVIGLAATWDSHFIPIFQGPPQSLFG